MAENKALYIIDASVILKWFLKEEESSLYAIALKDHFLEKKIWLAIPDFAYAEVLNTLGRVFNKKEALFLFSLLLEYNLDEFHITLELASLAVEFMKKMPKVSFYDSAYHALALQQNGTFVTADKKYFLKGKKQGHVMLLKDYGKTR